MCSSDLASERIRQLVRTDRGLLDKAQRAFVSWVRSYGAHQATSIFKASDLDWTDLGNAWGLLRLPRMPELKNWDGDKTLGQEVDWDNYAYKDKAREQARLQAIEDEKNGVNEEKAEEVKRKRKNNSAWSGKHEKEGVREERREKRRKKRDFEKTAKMTDDDKEKKAELDVLIQQVRAQNKVKDKIKEEEFEGFDD